MAGGIKKFVVGSFDDEAVLFPAVKNVRREGYKIHDIYTPFPVHGLDHAMGLRETSLHSAGFIYAITGTTTALTFMSWVFTKDWPLNIGGKPNFALPAWIPITFELTVLFAAVGMVLTFCYLCNLAPFVKKHHFLFDKHRTFVTYYRSCIKHLQVYRITLHILPTLFF